MIYVLRYALIALYTVFWGTFGLLLFLFVREGRATPFIVRNWVKWILWTCGIRVEAEGVERVAAAEPCIVMSNHQSVFDIAAIVVTIPVHWRFVAKKELLWIPFFGWAMALSDQIMVDRSNREKSVESLAAAAERVRTGANVIVFPEGTRQNARGLGEFKSGGFHLALQAGVPIVPVAVSGSRRITPRSSLRVESGRMLVRYGEPIPTKDLTLDDRNALKQRVRQAMLDGFDPELQA